MKKTMIATAVAAAFALPMAAQADVTVYGKINNSITNVEATTNNAATTEQWQVQDYASRLGFKGSEDLGGGLKAIWKYEMSYDTDETGAGCPGTDQTDTASTATNRNCSARNTYVGLAGDFGTFVVGRHDTPYKMAWYAGGADFADSTVADFNESGIGGDNVGDTHFDETRISNAIAYISPDMSGFKAALAIIPGETTNVEDGLADSWSTGLMYAGHGVKVGAGLESLADTAVTTPSEKRWHVTGSYTFNNISVGASYANVKNDANVEDDKKKSMGLSAQYAFGKSAVGANYRNSKLERAANDGDINSWAFFVSHAMSNRTKVYAAVAQHEYDEENGSANDQETNEYGFGIMHNF